MNRAFRQLGCLLLVTLISSAAVQAQPPSLEVGLDAVQRVQWLESEAGGFSNDEAPGFQHPLANVHLRGTIAQDVHTYVELHLNDRTPGSDEVEVNEAYLRYTGLRPLALKLGNFEVDFGEQHRFRSDNAQVQDNPFVGNSLTDPVAVQSGLELSGEAGPMDWSLAVTNGLDPNQGGFGFARSGRSFAYVANLRADGPAGLSGAFSYYTVDQSDLAPPRDNLFTPASTLANQYQGLGSAAGPTFTKGDVSAFQLDGAWEPTEATSLRAWWGRYEEDAAAIQDEIDYWSVQARQGFGPAYAAARFGRTDNAAVTTDEWEKLQVAAGYRVNEAALAKLEYVDQENLNTEDGFDGLVGEMSVSLPADRAAGADLDPSLDVGLDVVQRAQWLESENLGTDLDEDAGFQESLANLHLNGTLAEGVRTYVELHLNEQRTGSDGVEVNEAYVELGNPAGPMILKLGNFEVDFGEEHRFRSDNAQVQENPFVGNSLTDPVAVQSGLELSGEAGPMDWSIAATNGLDPDAGNTFSSDRSFAYVGKVGADFPAGLRGAVSYYTVDQSDVPAADNLFTPGVELVDAYQGLANPAAPGFARRDVDVYQIDGAWEPTEATAFRAWWGSYEGQQAASRDEIDYWSVEARQGFGPAYAAARWGELEDDVDPAQQWEKQQLALGYRVNEAALAKLEYVNQENEVRQSGFDGLVGEMSVSLPADRAAGADLDPSLDVNVDLAARLQTLESENNAAAGGEESGFQNALANVALTGRLTDDIAGIVELHLNSQRIFVTDQVHVRQAYVDLRDVLGEMDVKLGDFELDFGHQHGLRSDNGAVQDNRLVGNPLVDATAVQSGLELSVSGRLGGWSLAATNGTGEYGLTGATDRFADGRGWGLVGKLYLTPLDSLMVSASGYASDQRRGPASENLFSGSSGTLENTYQNLSLAGNATPTLGTGQDVAAFQADAAYEPAEGTRLLTFYGHVQDDDSPVHRWDYGSLEVSQHVSPSAYVVGRYGRAVDHSRSDAQDYEKIQLGTGYWITDRTLTKLEWVDQEQLGGLGAEFDGFVGEVSISF